MANKETKIINGAEITFYPDSHQYRINGKIIPSVTSILGLIDKSRPLLIWAENLSRDYLNKHTGEELTPDVIETAVTQYKQKRDEAADYGKQVHEWIETFIKSVINKTDKPATNSDMPKEVLNGIMGFLKWYNENEVEFLESERIVYSKAFNYVGTFDVLMKVNGIITLGDFKTGKAIYPEFWLQLSAYDEAYSEEDDAFCSEQWAILHFNKETGEYETATKEYTSFYFDHFENLLNLRTFLNANK